MTASYWVLSAVYDAARVPIGARDFPLAPPRPPPGSHPGTVPPDQAPCQGNHTVATASGGPRVRRWAAPLAIRRGRIDPACEGARLRTCAIERLPGLGGCHVAGRPGPSSPLRGDLTPSTRGVESPTASQSRPIRDGRIPDRSLASVARHERPRRVAFSWQLVPSQQLSQDM